VYSFEVLLVRDIGARFAQRRNFIAELESAIPQFYEQVGQHLKAWQASAPKLPEAKVEPSSVNTEAMRDAAEQVVSHNAASPERATMTDKSEDSQEPSSADAPSQAELSISEAEPDAKQTSSAE
jgi:hypothetical protein